MKNCRNSSLRFANILLFCAVMMNASCGQDRRPPDNLEELNRNIEQDPSNPKVYSDRADFYERKRDYKSVLMDRSKAIALDSTNFRLYMPRAFCYVQLRMPDSTIKDCNRILGFKENKVYGSVIAYRGMAYMFAGKYNEAIADTKEASRIDTSTDRFGIDHLHSDYNTIAGLSTVLGKYGDAITYCEKAIPIQQYNKSPDFHLLGVIQYRRGYFAEAKKALEKSIGLPQGMPFSYSDYYLTLVNAELDDVKASRDHLTTAIEKGFRDFDLVYDYPVIRKLKLVGQFKGIVAKAAMKPGFYASQEIIKKVIQHDRIANNEEFQVVVAYLNEILWEPSKQELHRKRMWWELESGRREAAKN